MLDDFWGAAVRAGCGWPSCARQLPAGGGVELWKAGNREHRWDNVKFRPIPTTHMLQLLLPSPTGSQQERRQQGGVASASLSSVLKLGVLRS